ncbi:LacI family transcriptional regulator [Nonlabens spongiae]|uniref:LacI family transcriptional regulator n=1 Tax=Nonlabens spongiae TaxID=331648 RepID=A0A1W6MP21_9FLAO|nr:LacI family DNA-binding transcriptional regulator [Nonlabens spongiae]ARN79209.1 LacI family transcriptional regulator [Nonlabens spongiae]
MVTLKDLATTLGVSVSTVSKALKDSPEISEETIKRVKNIAKELNYRPNTLALSLKNRKTMTIGVLIPDILNKFFSKILYGLELEAQKSGYQIITCLTNESLEREKKALDLLSNGSVDGFILSCARETQTENSIDHFKNIIDQGTPIVMFDRVANDVDCDKVIMDDYKAAYQATKKLISEGRENIVLFDRLEGLSVGKLRILGYRKAIEQSTEYQSQPKIHSTTDDQGSTTEYLTKMLKDDPSIDGLLCIDNIAGVKAVGAAQRLGKNIPQDLSVIGFASDDIYDLCYPKLTTVAQRASQIGQQSVKMLIDRIENNNEVKHSTTATVNFGLDLRGTTL